MNSIYDKFLQSLEEYHQRPAISDNCNTISYGELSIWSDNISQNLDKKGIDDPVVLIFARSPEIISTALALYKNGKYFSILDPTYPINRLKEYISEIKSKSIIFSDNTADVVFEIIKCSGEVKSLNVTPYHSFLVDKVLSNAKHIKLKNSSIAYLIFTSGTTGKPKVVITPHLPILHFIDWYVSTFKVSCVDRFSMLSGLAHDPIMRDIFVPLSIGACVCIPKQHLLGDPHKLVDWFVQEKISVTHITPSLAWLLCAGQSSLVTPILSHLRLIFLGGERLDFSLVSSLRKLAPNAQIVNCYGTTETPQIMAYYCLPQTADHKDGFVPIGSGIKDVDIMILNKKRNFVQTGEVGEICVASKYLSSGYLNRDDQTSECYLTPSQISCVNTTTYCTGDLGFIDSGGLVHYCGRVDNQLKINGFRVEPGDIESHLNNLDGVTYSTVVASKASKNSLKVVAFVTSASQLDLNVIYDSLRLSIPSYMVPSRIIQLDTMPLTPNGKVDRNVLTKYPLEMHTQGGSPHTETERRLVKIFEDILSINNIGIDDDFFRLGGDSLNAVMLLLNLEKEFGIQLQPAEILLNSQLSMLAKKIDDGNIESFPAQIVELNTKGEKSPIYWIPGGGGMSVTAFRDISHLIGGGHPVHGIVASGNGDTPSNVVSRAREYVQLILDRQPHGPYYLFGFSAGSWLAFEMALQMQSIGRKIGALVVFDMPVLSHMKKNEYFKLSLQLAVRHFKAFLSEPKKKRYHYLEQNVLPLYWEWLTDKRRRKNLAHATKYDRADYLNRKEARIYRRTKSLKKFKGTIVVVLADISFWSVLDESLDPRFGWCHLATEGIRTYRVPGQHISMLDKKNVERLSQNIIQEMNLWEK